MHTRFLLPLLALGLTAFPAAPALAQSASDFQLPPNPAPSPTPRAQGPVDDSATVPVAPRPIIRPTATPTATPSPAPTSAAPTASPSAQPSRPAAGATQPASSPRQPPGTPARATDPARTPSGLPSPGASAGVTGLPQDGAGGTAPGFSLPPVSPEASPPAPVAQADEADAAADESLPWWWWIAALAVALAALAAGLVALRRKASVRAPAPIVRPVVASEPAVADDDLLRYLKVEVEAVRLSRSLMAATLSYRLTLSNRAPTAMRNIVLDGDLTSAHGQAPIADQLADAGTSLPALHSVEHLGAGQRKVVTGDLRLELRSVRPIRQGNVPIYVPLVRLKAQAADAPARAFTFVVGKTAGTAGARLQPFRLDTPPQTFTEIDARPLG
ncbi:hypothetical protein WAB17_01560 [Parerythrobacter aurantius]|uniref:hypothetical protein n=1 Tax=Parerythrobacter aurantius TaxID=3127706 RepID=UPI003251A844